MSRTTKQIHTSQESFLCENCGAVVKPADSGTRNRNHCPRCLHSKHLDMSPGDRRSNCRGPMEPIGIWVQHNKEWSILHRCQRCGWIRANRIAGDDDERLLLQLAAQPLAYLPFPLMLGIERTQKVGMHNHE